MNIKRFLSTLLSVAMVATSFSNVYAASSNSITRIASVKEDSVIENVDLKIKPTSAVESGSSIIIDIENAEFDKDKIFEKTGKTFDELTKYDGNGEIIKPYEIKIINDTEIQVFLGGVENYETDIEPYPYYLIPLVAVSTSEEDVKVSIDANGTTISSTSHTIATSTAEDGKTTTKVNKVKKFSDVLYVDTITVKEDVYDTFKNGEVKVRVNGGFKIISDNIKVEAGINLDNSVSPEVKVENGGTYFTFKMPDEWTNTKKASSFTITGIKVEADDEDKNYGDVKLTISGSSANITKDTITVGSRQDFGFEFQTISDVPTIVAGRTADAHKDLDKDNFKSAKVKFEELTADTWLTNRKLEFTVPEGVKIIDADINKVKEISGLTDSVSITNDGKTLKIDKNLDIKSNRDSDKTASFEMELYLSIDADYTGDIELNVKGAGLAEGDLDPIVIAEAITPIKIDTTTTEVNLGYQSFATSDITISETQDGVLLDGEEVVITFDDKQFGNTELGFNDTNVEYTVNGELEIKNFEVKAGAITFKVDKSSYTEPASITISNITVGATRSIPYGSYALKVTGNAVVNNYEKNLDKIYPVALDKVNEKDNEDISYFDTIDGYSFDNYITVITATGTFDSTVEVTVGTTAIKVNGEEYEIDAYSYIQPTTNSTLVPLRAVAVALADGDITKADESSNIAWDAETKTVTIVYNGKIVQFQANSNYMVVDGTTIACDNGAVAEITDNRMYVPMRALGVALGVPVDWDAETRTAKYN